MDWPLIASLLIAVAVATGAYFGGTWMARALTRLADKSAKRDLSDDIAGSAHP